MLQRATAMKDGLQNGDQNPRNRAWSSAGRCGPLRIPFDASRTMKLAMTDQASGVAGTATAVAIYGTTRA